MTAAVFTVEATDGAARAGTVTTPRGTFSTPCFMPVGTRGAVPHLHSGDLEELGVEVVLANTYHLMLRPGAETVDRLGGIHGFAGWHGHVLTDSGGYQIYSLDPEVDDDGASFRSVYDGSTCRLTPEDAVRLQALIGADIIMVLDVCPSAVAERPVLQEAVRRTALWARRGRDAFLAHPDASQRQCQFGIVQGGADTALRHESAERTVEIGFDGYAVGGLSVGEDRAAMLAALDACIAPLPDDRPRYFMGLGDPAGIVESVARGVDMFDCVLPARLGRHGTVLSGAGRYNLVRGPPCRTATSRSIRRSPRARPGGGPAATSATCWPRMSRPRPGSSRCTTWPGCCASWTRCAPRCALEPLKTSAPP